MHFLARNQAGSQQLRQQMGHAEFGARVVYGDCLFYTLSPNEQHSAWVLRLSRYRLNDPCLGHDDELRHKLKACAGRQAPRLRQCETAYVEFPAYKFRRMLCARALTCFWLIQSFFTCFSHCDIHRFPPRGTASLVEEGHILIIPGQLSCSWHP